MAMSTLHRRGLARVVRRVLDTIELQTLVGELEQKRSIGRRGYGARALVGACLVKSLYGFPTWTRVARLVGEHRALKRALGGAPSAWACYRFTRKLLSRRRLLGECLDGILAALRARHPRLGLVVAIDSTDLAAYANGQRYRYKGGPEREAWSDHDASWGHRSAVSVRKGGGFYGYKLHLAACAETDLPVAWKVETAKAADMRHAGKILDRLPTVPETALMDAGYRYRDVEADCLARGVRPVIAPKRGSKQRLEGEARRLYQLRVAVEREFARLKEHHSLAPLRCRGLDRVRQHADLVMLTRLAAALV